MLQIKSIDADISNFDEIPAITAASPGALDRRPASLAADPRSSESSLSTQG
jgi:hypothetical protein